MAAANPGGTVYSRRIVQLVVQTAGIQQATAAAASSLSSLEKSINSLKNAFLAFGAFKAAEIFRDVVDAGIQLDNMLTLLNLSGPELARTQALIAKTANDARSPIDATTKLYVKLSVALGNLGKSQKDVLEVTEAITKGLRLGSATAGESASAILQLSQAFSANRLQGDEFRALLENSIILGKALAEQLGTDIGGLRAMAKAGELTAEKVADAFQRALPKIREEFAKLNPTIADFFTLLRNEAINTFQTLNQQYGILKNLGNAITLLSENIGLLSQALIYLATIAITRYVVVAFVSLRTAMLAAGSASLLVSAQFGALLTFFGGLPGLIVVALSALTLFITTMETALEKTGRLREEAALLTTTQLTTLITDLRDKRDELLAKQEAMRTGERPTNKYDALEYTRKQQDIEAAIGATNVELARYEQALIAANGSMSILKQTSQETIEVMAGFDTAMTEFGTDKLALEEKIKLLNAGNIKDYDAKILREKSEVEFLKKKKEMEKDSGGPLGSVEEALLRVRIDGIVHLTDAEDKAHKAYLKRISDGEAAAKKAISDAKAAASAKKTLDRETAATRKREAAEFDKYVAKVAAFHPEQDLTDEIKLIQERLGWIGKSEEAVADLEAQQKALLAVQKIQQEAAKDELFISGETLKNVKILTLERERGLVLEQQRQAAKGHLTSIAEAENPKLGIQKEIDQIGKDKDLFGDKMTPEQLTAVNDRLTDLKLSLSAIAQISTQLQSIGSPFAGLAVAAEKFSYAFNDAIRDRGKQIVAFGQGALATAAFITDQMATLGVESFNIQKGIAIATATINAALAVTKVLAEGGVFAIPLVAAIAALTGAQIAVIAAQQPPARAYGGVVNAGRRYMVGEQGPEMYRDTGGRQIMIPSAQGQITPMRGGAGGVTIINNGPPVRVAEKSVDDDGRITLIITAAVTAAEDKFENSLRSGQGKFHRALKANTSATRQY